MPITLNDYASLIKDEMAQGLFMNMQRANDVLKIFPVVEVGALVVRGSRWDVLPSHDFRKLNADFNESTGSLKPVEDKLAIYGGKFSEDEAFEQMKNELFRDPVEQQFAMHSKAIERGLMHHLVNGDIDTEPDGFDGLYKRISDTSYFAAAQTVSASGTTDALKVHASATNSQSFLDKQDEGIYQAGLFGVPEAGVPKGAILMNKNSYLGIQKAARLASYSLYVRDLLGYTWNTYRDLPLIDVGLQRDKSTEIIGNTYDPGDGGDDSSRIFIVRFSEPDGNIESPGSDGLTLVQAGPLRRLGPIASLTSREWGMEWILGLAHVGDEYCVSMLVAFKMAAS
jgi:hypothetical protein